MLPSDEAEAGVCLFSVLGDAVLVACSTALGSAASLTSQPLRCDRLAARLSRRVERPVLEASADGFLLVSPGRLILAELLQLQSTRTAVLGEIDGSVWVLQQRESSPWTVFARFSLLTAGSRGEVEQVCLERDSLTFTWLWREEGSVSARIFSRRLCLGDSLSQTSLSATTSVAAVDGWCKLSVCSTTVWLLYREGVLAVDLCLRSRLEFRFQALAEPLRSSALKLRSLLPVSTDELLCHGSTQLMLFRRLKNQTLILSRAWKLEMDVQEVQVAGGLLLVLDNEALRAYRLNSILPRDHITPEQCTYVKYLPNHQHIRRLWAGLNEDDTINVGLICGLETLEIIWTIAVREGAYSLCGLSIADTYRSPLDTSSPEPQPYSSFITKDSMSSHDNQTEDEESWLSYFDEDLNFRSDLPLSSYQALLCQHYNAAGCKFDVDDVLKIIRSQDFERVFRFHFLRGKVEILHSVHHLAHLLHFFSSCETLVTQQEVYLRCLAVSLNCPENMENQAQQNIVLILLLLCQNYVMIERLLLQWGRKASLEKIEKHPFKIRHNESMPACFVNF